MNLFEGGAPDEFKTRTRAYKLIPLEHGYHGCRLRNTVVCACLGTEFRGRNSRFEFSKKDSVSDDLDGLVDQRRPEGYCGHPLNRCNAECLPEGTPPCFPSRGDVRKVIHAHRGDIAKCGRKRDDKLPVTLQFNIHPDGTTGSITVFESDVKGTPEAVCVKKVVSQMQFPRSQSGATRVLYPFDLDGTKSTKGDKESAAEQSKETSK